MATLTDSTFVESFKFTHNAKISLLACRTGPSNNLNYGKKFSPLPGFIFQLQIVKTNDKTFSVFLINCGAENVELMSVRIGSKLLALPTGGSMSLVPQTPLSLGGFKFTDYIRGYIFECCLTIEAKPKDLKYLGDNSDFLKDFAKEMDDPTFADVTLVCEGKQVQCHRVILAAKSDYFRTMFAGDNFLEGRTGKAEIEELDLATLKEMLSYIYTNKFDTNADIAQLLVAADRFLISNLRERCEDLLISSLSVGNAVKIFLLSYHHDKDGSKLKNASMDFIGINLLEIRKGQEWARLRGEPDGAAKIDEILAYVMAKK